MKIIASILLSLIVLLWPVPSEGVTVDPNDPQLIAHWTLDEGTGDTALDLVGGFEAAVIGPNWVDGVLDGALWFDGIDDVVDCGTEPTLIPERLSISIWVKADDVSEQATIIGKGESPFLDLQVTLSSGHVIFEFESDDPNTMDFVSIRSSVTLDRNEWHFIAVTRDGADAILYIDGAQDNAMPYAFPVTAGDLPLKIGEAPFTGTIDDVRIFHRSLFKDEILTLMSDVSPDLFLVGHWTLDEQEGDVVYDNAGTHDGMIIDAQRIDGIMGQALHFDGDARVEIITEPNLCPLYMTACLWVMPEEASFCRIWRNETIEDRDYEFFIGDDAVSGFRFGPDDPESLENIRALHGYAAYNEWNFFAATRDGQHVTFFMQGELLDTQPYSVIPSHPGDLLILGQKPFKGALDDVRLYRTALTEEQILTLYEAPFTPDPNTLLDI